MAGDRVQDSIDVAASPDEVMEVIADFEAYPEWQPEFREVEILETDDDGWGTKVRFVVDAKVMQATLVLDYTYEDDAMRWELVEGDGVKRNDGAYLLEDKGDGTTHVTYEVEIEPSVPMPGMLRRKAAKKIATGALRGMKQRVEQGA
jgi:ribosome-associated toxin RatA of RatAB toxin-antitoxin module